MVGSLSRAAVNPLSAAILHGHPTGLGTLEISPVFQEWYNPDPVPKVRQGTIEIEVEGGAFGLVSSRAIGPLAKLMFESSVDSIQFVIAKVKPRAFRRMAVKFHPDKVRDMGEDYQKQARERFDRITAAYEAIKKQRGIK